MIEQPEESRGVAGQRLTGKQLRARGDLAGCPSVWRLPYPETMVTHIGAVSPVPLQLHCEYPEVIPPRVPDLVQDGWLGQLGLLRQCHQRLGG